MSLGDTIKEYWGFILFLIGLAFHAVWVYFQVAEHKDKFKEINIRIQGLEIGADNFRELMKVDIQEIKTTMLFVKEMIQELKKK